MDKEIFLTEFGHLAQGPDGVKKLRDLILQLAVQGKLVGQDSDDEPASVLLEKIEAEKKNLIAKGVFKKSRQKPKEISPLFLIPKSWKWISMAETGHEWGQEKPSQDFLYIDVSVIDNVLGKVGSNVPLITPEDAPSRARKLVKPGTVIYSTVRPYLKNIAVIEQEYSPKPIASTAFAVIAPFSGIDATFIKHYLRSPDFVGHVESQMMGMAYPAINDSKFFASPFPLPPLAEQKRIVAKVDELMALCDELEASQETNVTLKRDCVASTLHHLSEASDKDEIKSNWSIAENNFGKWFDDLETVKNLRATILQLAVQGKLVEQDPNDEPASVLLEKVKAEGICAKNKYQSSNQQVDAQLPRGWARTELGNLISIRSGDGLTKANMELGSIPVFGGNGITGYHSSSNVIEPTLVIGRVGFYCGSVHITPAQAWVTDNAFITTFSEYCFDIEFLYWLLRTTNLKERDSATAQPVISGKKVYPIIVTVPPKGEQKRIVAKVNQLMTLCDELEAQILSSQTLNQSLMASLCHHMTVN